MSDPVASASLLAITSSVSAFGALLPPFAEVRKSVSDDAMALDVRIGEAAAFTLVLAIGLTASSLSGSSVPAMVSVIAAVSLVSLYEYTLQHQPRKVATTHDE